MIETNVVEIILSTFLGLSGVYLISLLILLPQCCCFGRDHRCRPWSPCVFYTRDWLYNHIIRNPICFVTIVISCWAISILNLKPNPFESMNGDTIENYIFDNSTVIPIFEKVKKYNKTNNEFYSMDLHGFENLVNVLLPLFFAVALQKYMTTRNEFLGFCGEVEFMAIYFMTLTNNEENINGKLESQLKRIKTILCMMPTTVYELEKNRDLKPEDLYYDHFKEGNKINCGEIIFFTENRLNVKKIDNKKNRINHSIYRDIKKLRETGLGLFECLLHLLIGYIDKIKQEKSAYNTSLERDFIVKWNHINAGWGNIDNSATYKTPVLLDVMFRSSLCVYAFFKPRTILFTCEGEVCENLVWASFGAIFPYLILFVFSDILQDPFQDYKVNPTVTNVAFDTQHNVKKLFNLQLGICGDNDCETKHHFSYDDGYDGYNLKKCDNNDCYDPKRKKKMSLLKKCVPLNADKMIDLFKLNQTLFNRCTLYKNQDTLNWKEMYEIMTDFKLWKIDDNIIGIDQYLKNKLGWRQYDQIMFSIYSSNTVRKIIQKIVFSGQSYEDVLKKINKISEAMRKEVKNVLLNNGKKTCEKIDLEKFTDVDIQNISNCNNEELEEYYKLNDNNKELEDENNKLNDKNGEMITENKKLNVNGKTFQDELKKDKNRIQNNAKIKQNKAKIKQNKAKIKENKAKMDLIQKENIKFNKGFHNIWVDIRNNIENDTYEFSSENRQASTRSFYIDIFKNKNRDGHLKFV